MLQQQKAHRATNTQNQGALMLQQQKAHKGNKHTKTSGTLI